MGKQWKQWETLFSWAPKSLKKITEDADCSHKVKRFLLLGRKAITNLGSILKSKDKNPSFLFTYFADKNPSIQSYGFSSSHVWMWKLDPKESWAQKNWCFWTVVLEKFLESPLDCKEIQPVHPKGNQSWIFIGRTDVEAESPILWLPDVKNWLIVKDPDAGKDWSQEAKGQQRVRWLDGITNSMDEPEQALRVGNGQRSLACCSPGGNKNLDMTDWLNWTELNWFSFQQSHIF